MKSRNKRSYNRLLSGLKTYLPSALMIYILILLSGCTYNNTVDVHNNSSDSITVDYYIEESFLDKMLESDEEDDVTKTDEEEPGGHRIVIYSGSSEEFEAANNRSIYISAKGIVFAYSSEHDISIDDGTIEARAFEIFEDTSRNDTE